jgi:hypothetical protein
MSCECPSFRKVILCIDDDVDELHLRKAIPSPLEAIEVSSPDQVKRSRLKKKR